jgi:DNA mismatch repair protein MutS2
MKSFGLVGQMVKLGLPIPIRTDERPVVGFFDQIITALGDRQSVTSGQSTFMAQLSTFATTLESLEGKGSDQTLVLLDELGSGTESDGGGAIGQAVLEHMLESRSCRIVATTHSPRLKALSFDDDRFACATVLLEENTGLRLPSYRLEVRR